MAPDRSCSSLQNLLAVYAGSHERCTDMNHQAKKGKTAAPLQPATEFCPQSQALTSYPKYRFSRHDKDVFPVSHLHLVSNRAIVGILSHLNYLMDLLVYTKVLANVRSTDAGPTNSGE